MLMKRSSGLKDLWRITSVFFELKKRKDRIIFMKKKFLLLAIDYGLFSMGKG